MPNSSDFINHLGYTLNTVSLPKSISTPIHNNWHHIVDTYSPAQIEFTGNLSVQLLFFWLPCFIYWAIDQLAPEFSARHKLQSGTAQPTNQDYWICLQRVLKNQLLSIALQLVSLYLSSKTDRPSTLIINKDIPTIAVVIRDIIICVLIREVMFYYSHRLLHHPKFYSQVHKVHHKFTAPVALSAQYAHFFEHIVANTLPIIIPPVIIKSHIISFWAFLAFQLIETTTVHSGYDFFAGWAKFHDLHHEKFLVHFGVIGLLDWIHKTDGSIRDVSKKTK